MHSSLWFSEVLLVTRMYFCLVTSLVEAVFTEEDRKYLRTLAEEVPKLRAAIKELLETVEILGDEELLRSVRAGERDVRAGRLLGFKELLKELGLNEKEV